MTGMPAPAARGDLVETALEEDQPDDDSQAEAPMRAKEEKSDREKELGERAVRLKAAVTGPLDFTEILMPVINEKLISAV